MSALGELIHQQLLENTKELKEVEAEIIRKYQAGEDCSEDVTKALGLKTMQAECVRMLAQKGKTFKKE